MNPIEENNKSTMLAQGAGTAVVAEYFNTAYIAVIPWFLVAIPLVFIDLVLGRQKAKKDGEDVTLNKSFRMTIDKLFSYICWIMLSTSMSIAFSIEWIKYVIMGLIYGLEVWSVFGKWLYCRYNVKVSDVQMLRIGFRMLWIKLFGVEENFKEVFKEETTDKV